MFIEEVRTIDVRGRTHAGLGRGGDLRSHDEWMQVCLQQTEQLVDVPRLRRLWDRWRELPREAADAMTHGVMTHGVMTHGDLTPGNVLVSDGRLAGILDVGGLGPADPALDLGGAWHLPSAVLVSCSDRSSFATSSSGGGIRRGPSIRRWAPSGATSGATRR